MSTLAEFLLACIAEDEETARDTDPLPEGAVFDHDVSGWWKTPRVLAECEAKRRIVAWVQEYADSYDAECGGDLAAEVLGWLALPYAGRPGYREEWRPA